MSLGITDTQNYANIADAIRAKNGTANTYTPAQMAAAILAIPGGGGGNTDVLIGAVLPYPKATDTIT